MKIKILIPFLALLFLMPISSCKKVDTTEEVPGCIKRKIRKFERNSNLSTVTKYDYKSSEIYQFNFFDLRGTSYIYDADCGELCTSKNAYGRNMCNEILDVATNQRIIWQSE